MITSYLDYLIYLNLHHLPPPALPHLALPQPALPRLALLTYLPTYLTHLNLSYHTDLTNLSCLPTCQFANLPQHTRYQVSHPVPSRPKLCQALGACGSPQPALPCLPCLTLPCLTSPYFACPALPHLPHPTCLTCLTCLPQTALPYLALPQPALSCPALSCLTCLASPVSSHCLPVSLACLNLPYLTSPCLSHLLHQPRYTITNISGKSSRPQSTQAKPWGLVSNTCLTYLTCLACLSLPEPAWAYLGLPDLPLSSSASTYFLSFPPYLPTYPPTHLATGGCPRSWSGAARRS